jgi:hypothetical protein
VSGKGEATAFRRQNIGLTTMTNDLTKKPSNLPANYEEEADAILAATHGHEKLLKFVKGKYKVRDDEVPLGTQFVAHANQLTFCWIKFADNKVAERRMGKAIDRYVPPEREELDEWHDKSKWETGLDGKPKDPWSFQHLLPFENLESGDVVIFTTSSVGGQIATDELCNAWGRHAKRNRSRAMPIVKLASKMMKTRFGADVPRPCFEVDGWDEGPAGNVEDAASEPSDSIPF